jgi:hypothetical protein
MLEREPVDPEATATFATELFLGAIERLGREKAAGATPRLRGV